MPTKNWWQSKTIWAGIFGTLRAVYQTLQAVLPAYTNIHLPPVPPIVDGLAGMLLGAAAVHGRWTADSTIGPSPYETIPK